MIMGIYLFSLFTQEELDNRESIFIDPIIIPTKNIQEDEDFEILEKLKVATDAVLNKSGLSEEEEAIEILAILKSFEQRRTEKLMQELLVKKRAKERAEAIVKKRAKERAEAIVKKRAKERAEAIVKKRAKERAEAIAKQRVILGDQHDLHILSTDEAKIFKNLEIVSESKPFVLEGKLEIKSPKKYSGAEKEIDFEALPFVETLGVVSVSKPFVKKSD